MVYDKVTKASNVQKYQISLEILVRLGGMRHDRSPSKPLMLKGDMKAIIASAVELLGEISQIQWKHVNVSPCQLTAYDGYCQLIDIVKSTIPREMIVTLNPSCDQDSSIEQVLTPSFVFYLAFARLARILDVNLHGQ
jgi:hypothetical protein